MPRTDRAALLAAMEQHGQRMHRVTLDARSAVHLGASQKLDRFS
jgi:hypothetical protein